MKGETAKSPDTGDRAFQHMRPTDRSSAYPLWTQVKSSLTAMIVEQGLEPGAKLPSETELCRSFGVSRTVVREALAQMVSEGLIYRHQGKGAFVRDRRDEQDFVSTTVGFSGELAEKSHQVTRRVLKQARQTPGNRVRRYLKIDESENIVSVDRVMLVDGRPRAIVRWSMLAQAVPGLESLPLENRSLYETISRQYGIRLNRAERWIEAISLGTKDATLLDVAPGRAALCIESVASAGGDTPIEYFMAVYLTDRSRLHISVRAPN